MAKLTSEQYREVPFELCFKYPLKKGYTFNELSKSDIKAFQSFLDKIARMTVTQVDKLYARKPDANDFYGDTQVYHYAVTDGFRIHVVNEGGFYKIIRLDPNHKMHSK